MQTRFSELHDLLDRQVVPNALAALQSLIQKKNHPGITQRTRRRQAREHLAHRQSIAQAWATASSSTTQKRPNFQSKIAILTWIWPKICFLILDFSGHFCRIRNIFATLFLRLRDCLIKKCCVLWIFLSSTGFRFLPQHCVWKLMENVSSLRDI